MINGRLHRLSARALKLLNIKEHDTKREVPIELQKLPPNLDVIKIQKKEEIQKMPIMKEAEAPVEVKKKEDVIVESTEKPKRKRHGKVGTEK